MTKLDRNSLHYTELDGFIGYLDTVKNERLFPFSMESVKPARRFAALHGGRLTACDSGLLAIIPNSDSSVVNFKAKLYSYLHARLIGIGVIRVPGARSAERIGGNLVRITSDEPATRVWLSSSPIVDSYVTQT